ncbi:DNA polymerase III subunit gamma/tau [Novosphingobium sp.]|uniref:DNA polymerase III subunit gamma/tau n=1 Tax=Novosphingobium sp. TaxID=1874826 RepID=UPI00333F2D61
MPDSNDMFGDPSGPDDDTPTAAELEAAGQSALFGDPAPPPSVPAAIAAPATAAPASAVAAPPQPYRVLARKYRSQTFSELIGQDAMVQTLANAIRRGRLAHAFLMTGIRGVGKTSTARLIAKALNCIGADGQGGPTIDPCGVCEPCCAIAEGRHIDVIEMDAASHTGVDDMRAVIDAVRYMAVTARYKIYIIDEVHMLSKNAFNALLKTLEEPPPHVKFLFATTDVEKLPVTVLSRCQRFDLRRIEAPVLTAHFRMICEKEAVAIDDEALALIVAAAEGSVRDGLSILDQAISHADLASAGGVDGGVTQVNAAQVREMLGLADRAMQRRLFAALLAGNARALIDEIAGQYALGVEPVALMRAQLDLVHRVTLAQVTGACDAPGEDERAEIEHWAKTLGAGPLHRLWQLALKGYDEARSAPDPLAAVQMALLRVMHAADMPDPGGLVRQIEGMLRDAAHAAPGAPAQAGAGDAPVATGTPAPRPRAAVDWAALVEQVEASAPLVGSTMRLAVRVIDLAPGTLRYALAPGIPGDPTNDMRRALELATASAWDVVRAEGPDAGIAAPSLEEARAAQVAAQDAAMHEDPLVKAVLAAFPAAQIVNEPGSAEPGARPWSKRA